MATIIGRTGQTMGIRSDGAVTTHRVEEEEAFSWTAATAVPTTADTAILVTNDSTTKHLHITSLYCYVDIATTLDFFAPAFAAFTGTAITGVALNRTGVTVAPATALGITTGDTLANIFATLYTRETATDQEGIWLHLDGLMVLGYHDSVGIAIVGNAGTYNAAVMGYYHDNHGI